MNMKSSFRKFIIPFAMVEFVAACVAPASFAATTATFNVSTTVTTACGVSLDGSIGLTLADPTGTNTMTVTCTNLAPWIVNFTGLNDGPAAFEHQMKDATTNLIRYIITGAVTTGYTYGNADRMLAGSTYGVSAVGTGAAQTVALTATARTAGSSSFQFAPTGSYSDVITATVTF